MSPEIVAVAMFILTIVFGIIGYLLSGKDAAQEARIDLLFKKHDDDVEQLRILQLEVFGNHYKRPELDAKFDRLDMTIREGLKELGTKFDRLANLIGGERGQQ